MVGLGAKTRRDEARQTVLDGPYGAPRGQPQAVGHPEDMGIDGDRGLAEGGIQDHVRGLATDARQGLQCRAPVGDPPAVVADQALAGGEDVARLGVIESDAADIALQAVFAERQQAFGVGGRPKERAGGLVHAAVGGLGRQDHGHEQLKRGRVLQFGGGLRVMRLEPFEQDLPLLRPQTNPGVRRAGSGRHRAPARAARPPVPSRGFGGGPHGRAPPFPDPRGRVSGGSHRQ